MSDKGDEELKEWKSAMEGQVEDEQVKEWKAIIKGQDKRLEGLLNTAFQLANYYFVFQGVILAALSNGKSLACENRWFLFTLSFIAVIVNLCALIATGTKYINGSRRRHQTWGLYNFVMEERERSGRHGPRRSGNCLPARDLCSEVKQKVMFASCVVLFVTFAVVTLAGCLWIGCRHHGDDNDITTRYDGHAALSCVKICS